jgi:hypothetical protein
VAKDGKTAKVTVDGYQVIEPMADQPRPRDPGGLALTALIARHRHVFAAKWQTAIFIAMLRRALACEIAAARGGKEVRR